MTFFFKNFFDFNFLGSISSLSKLAFRKQKTSQFFIYIIWLIKKNTETIHLSKWALYNNKKLTLTKNRSE